MLNAETSAGFVVFRMEGKARKYLLLHYTIGHWDYVKGHIEGEETEIQAALREAKEEANLTDLNILDGFREKITYHYKRAGKFMTKDVIFYVAETNHAEIKLSHEHSGFKWLEFDAALKQITYDSSKEILKKVDMFLDDYGKQKTLSSFG